MNINSNDWNLAMKYVKDTFDKKSNREEMNGIHLEKEKGSDYILITTLDGYSASRTTLKTSDTNLAFKKTIKEVITLPKNMLIEMELRDSEGTLVFTGDSFVSATIVFASPNGVTELFNKLLEVTDEISEIYVNPKLLVNSLRGVNGENVKITVGSAVQPIKIESEQGQKLVMPVGKG